MKIKTGSRVFSIFGSALWNALLVPMRYAHTILTFGKILKSHLHYLIWLSHPSSSVAQLPVDEPALASIMTHDHANDLCASELGSLRI